MQLVLRAFIRCFALIFLETLYTLIWGVAVAVIGIILLLINVRWLWPLRCCFRLIIVIVGHDRTWCDCISWVVYVTVVIIVVVRVLRFMRIVRCRHWRIISWIGWRARSLLDVVWLIVPVILHVWILIIRLIVRVIAWPGCCCRCWSI